MFVEIEKSVGYKHLDKIVVSWYLVGGLVFAEVDIEKKELGEAYYDGN